MTEYFRNDSAVIIQGLRNNLRELYRENKRLQERACRAEGQLDDIVRALRILQRALPPLVVEVDDAE